MDSPKISWFLCSIFLINILSCSYARQAGNLLRLMKAKQKVREFDTELDTEISRNDPDFPSLHAGQGNKEGDKIHKLPGQPRGVNFDQYAGYVTVDSNNGRALFYYFVESETDEFDKPLILWLNGGPGCSSLGFGAMQEIGPFRVNSDGRTLRRNKHAWNKLANIIFLEAPAGVGFSYSNTSLDYELNGDKRMAEDSYAFLIGWFEKFKEYKMNEFFIAGESYAGHYVTQLASFIISKNAKLKKPAINLKGIAIGNAFLDDYTTFMGTVEFLWTHAMISDETHSLIKKNCSITKFNSADCFSAQDQSYKELGLIEFDNIYAPICQKKTSSETSEFDPCTDDYVLSYLNLVDVQRALHAVHTAWNGCSNITWRDSPESMLGVMKQVMASGLNVWLYSGDTDAVVPVTATRYFLDMLGSTVQSLWRPWYTKNEVGGYVVIYEGLTFATVRGAGHEVPSYQSERSLTILSAFLQGNHLPVF